MNFRLGNEESFGSELDPIFSNFNLKNVTKAAGVFESNEKKLGETFPEDLRGITIEKGKGKRGEI